MREALIQKLMGKIIVSCQAYEDTPLYGSQYMKAMAQSALIGGAGGIRACWKQDIAAIREIGDFPIVGINKIFDPSKKRKDQIVITPNYQAAKEVIDAGCDIVALDCSIKPFRGKEELVETLTLIRENYPEIIIMADCATFSDGMFVAEKGLVDILSTTLSASLKHQETPDVELILAFKNAINIPVNAEGKVWDLNHLEMVIAAGADMVTIGTAITRPHLITERFVKFNDDFRKGIS